MKWLLIAILVYSCNNSSSSILPQKKMQAVMWDIMKADAFAQQLAAKDSLKKLPEENKKLVAGIFLIHNITAEQFKKSYQYYLEHPDILKIIVDSINAQQSRKTFTAPFIKKSLVL